MPWVGLHACIAVGAGKRGEWSRSWVSALNSEVDRGAISCDKEPKTHVSSVASGGLLSLAGCLSGVCRQTREGRGWSAGMTMGDMRLVLSADSENRRLGPHCHVQKRWAVKCVPEAGDRLVPGIWRTARPGCVGQRPAGGGGRQEPDHGCREHLRDRGDFFSPLRGAEPRQSQQEGEKSAWGAGPAAAAPLSTAGWVAEELAGAAHGGGQAALAPCCGHTAMWGHGAPDLPVAQENPEISASTRMFWFSRAMVTVKVVKPSLEGK